MTVIAFNPNVSIEGMPNRYYGLSSDTKPTVDSHAGLPTPTTASRFVETDSGLEYVTYDGTNWFKLQSGISGTLKAVRVSQAIDGSLGAYAVGDVVGADDCCTTLAIAWDFDVARIAGGYFYITGATLVYDTENQAVQYDLLLFNATPTGELRDNAANTNPVIGDRTKYLGLIEFPTSVAKGATVATYTEATPSTVGRLPKPMKCATGTTHIYGVLVTNTVYTPTATDPIDIVLYIEEY